MTKICFSLLFLLSINAIIINAKTVEVCGIGNILLDNNLTDTKDAQLGEVVWHAAVESKGLIGGQWKTTCGGVVIAKNAILTSASCVEGQFPGMNRVQSGIVVLPKGGFFAQAAGAGAGYPGESKPTQSFIESVKKHPNFDKNTLANNLAILSLAMPFNFDKTEGNISDICMPEKLIKDFDKTEKTFISGWRAGIDNNNLNKQLKISPSKIVDCPKDLKLNENEFCVSQQQQELDDDALVETTTAASETSETPTDNETNDEPEEFKCEGDMGGSLFTTNTDTKGSLLLGIASYGKNCTDNDPMIYIDVFPYIDWIKEQSKPHY